MVECWHETQEGDAMKRFRLSTLMLLVVIAAQSTTLVVQHERSVRREAELDAKIKRLEAVKLWMEFHGMEGLVLGRYQSYQAAEKRLDIEPMEVIEMGKR